MNKEFGFSNMEVFLDFSKGSFYGMMEQKPDWGELRSKWKEGKQKWLYKLQKEARQAVAGGR